MLHGGISARGFRKSSFSEAGNCVEVASGSGSVLIRDSKHRNEEILLFPSSAWEEFIQAIHRDVVS
jgi:hypothetical protein